MRMKNGNCQEYGDKERHNVYETNHSLSGCAQWTGG